MNAKKVLAVLSVLVLVLAAFYLGQRTGASSAKKKVQIKKQVSARKVKKAAVVTSVASKSSGRARAAIVIDDFGYNTHNLETLFDIELPVTLSILPNLPYSRDVANSAKKRGYEVILHLPLASHRKDVKEEPGTIESGESEKDVLEQLNKDIETVPGIRGVSNHMGSAATEDEKLMSEIFTYLKKRGLYFFDSLTSGKSICRVAAESEGIRFAKRDMFLDNVDKVDAIEQELASFKKMVLRRGHAIAICHDRKNTIRALARAMPEMAKDGIEFVSLSEMVK